MKNEKQTRMEAFFRQYGIERIIDEVIIPNNHKSLTHAISSLGPECTISRWIEQYYDTWDCGTSLLERQLWLRHHSVTDWSLFLYCHPKLYEIDDEDLIWQALGHTRREDNALTDFYPFVLSSVAMFRISNQTVHLDAMEVEDRFFVTLGHTHFLHVGIALAQKRDWCHDVPMYLHRQRPHWAHPFPTWDDFGPQ